jgi:HAD superfamily hydrolase (TIGR01509 family)
MSDRVKNTAPTVVAFDLDGVIANTEDLYEQAGEMVLARRGKTYDAALREQMMGRPVVDALQIMIDCHSLPDSLAELMCECKDVLQRLMETSLAAMPGLMKLLDELETAKVPFAVATSATREYAEFVLGRLQIRDRFRFVLTADDIRCGKPDPEIYLLTAATFEVATTQMMVLEDTGNGCLAATAAGAFTVAVPNRHTREHRFPPVAFVAESLGDLRILGALKVQPLE